MVPQVRLLLIKILQGGGSSNFTPTSLSDSLVNPSPQDEVVLEKNGLSITDVFIGNVQTKLARGVILFIDKNGTSRVTFREAIDMINELHPEHAFT